MRVRDVSALAVILVVAIILAFPAARFVAAEDADPVNAAAGVLRTGIRASENPFSQAKGELGTVQAQARVGTRELEEVIGNFIKAALSLVGVFFFGYIVWAGYLWMTAHGEEEKITQAKKMISGGVIGLVIVLAAYAITIFVTSKLTASAGIQ